MIPCDYKENTNDKIEPFNVENVNNPEIKININQIDLNNYFKINSYYIKKEKKSKKEKISIEEASIKDLNDIDIYSLIASIIFSFIFYFVVITKFLTDSTLLTIFAILIYIGGTFFLQILIIPTSTDFLENSEQIFEDDLKKLLNCHVEYFFKISKVYKITYPGKYVTDATGVITIPKDINFVKINKIQFFAEEDFEEFSDIIYTAKKECHYYYKLIYNEKEIDFKEKIYNINNYPLVNITTTILFLLMLGWIQAIYYRYHPNCLKMLIITPYKLITKNKSVPTSTKIIFKNKEIKPENNYITLNSITSKEYDKFEEEKKYYLKRIENDEKEKQRIEENTYVLSLFKNNNYTIKVKREDNDVYLYFQTRDGKHYLNNYYLGEYNPDIKKEIYYEDRTTIYQPKGVKCRIEVTNYEFKFNLKINDDFSRSYDYVY